MQAAVASVCLTPDPRGDVTVLSRPGGNWAASVTVAALCRALIMLLCLRRLESLA